MITDAIAIETMTPLTTAFFYYILHVQCQIPRSLSYFVCLFPSSLSLFPLVSLFARQLAHVCFSFFSLFPCYFLGETKRANICTIVRIEQFVNEESNRVELIGGRVLQPLV
jgi:hypothetical protein